MRGSLATTREAAMQVLRAKAGSLGADGVTNLRCAGPGEVGYPNHREGDLYLCRTTSG